jgi:hypothetical protein
MNELKILDDVFKKIRETLSMNGSIGFFNGTPNSISEPNEDLHTNLILTISKNFDIDVRKVLFLGDIVQNKTYKNDIIWIRSYSDHANRLVIERKIAQNIIKKAKLEGKILHKIQAILHSRVVFLSNRFDLLEKEKKDHTIIWTGYILHNLYNHFFDTCVFYNEEEIHTTKQYEFHRGKVYSTNNIKISF